jgi:hypothetical protein
MGKNKRPLTPIEKYGRLLFEHSSQDDVELKPVYGLNRPLEQYTNEEIVKNCFYNKPQFALVLQHLSLERRLEVLWVAANR